MKEDTERVPLTENRVPLSEQKSYYANKCPVCEHKIESEKECLEHLKENHTEGESNRGFLERLNLVQPNFFGPMGEHFLVRWKRFEFS